MGDVCAKTVILTVYDAIIIYMLYHCLGAGYWAGKYRPRHKYLRHASDAGTERLEKALSGIDSSMSSSEIIDAILKDVTDFTGSADQYDDMTIVAIRKQSHFPLSQREIKEDLM